MPDEHLRNPGWRVAEQDPTVPSDEPIDSAHAHRYSRSVSRIMSGISNRIVTRASHGRWTKAAGDGRTLNSSAE